MEWVGGGVCGVGGWGGGGKGWVGGGGGIKGGWGVGGGVGYPPLPTHPPLRFTREQTRVEYIRRCRLIIKLVIIVQFTPSFHNHNCMREMCDHESVKLCKWDYIFHLHK